VPEAWCGYHPAVAGTPIVGSDSVRVHLRRDAGRLGASTGPWIRARQVAKVNGPASAACIAEIVDRRGETAGWGLYSEASSIAVRVLSWSAERPPETWLQTRIEQAVRARGRLGFGTPQTDGYRVINSEGDGLPGLVVDRYGPDAVIQLTTAPMVARRSEIVSQVREHLPVERVHVLVPESAAKHEGVAPEASIEGDPDTLTFHEAGLRFTVDPPPAQKTGAYFDQRDNRRWVAAAAARIGGGLLDVGCHVGGFALHAAAHGVPAVGVDSSKRALARGAANADAAGLSGVTWVETDMFGRLDDPALTGPFGTIVFDPPKLAARKSDVDKAVGAMTRTLGRLATRVTDGGIMVLCSCSHHLSTAHLDRAVSGAGSTTWARIATLGPDVDHPVAPSHREGEYLVVAVYQRRA